MSKLKKLFFYFSVGAFVFGSVFLINAFQTSENQKAHATSQSLGGYGWSSTIGWISFNGVPMDSSGNLSGYAWSSNIGWLKLGGGQSGFPSGNGTTNANANLSSGGNLTGWGRFCAGKDDLVTPLPDQTGANNTCNGVSRLDGWDGWLSFKGAGYGVSQSNNDGPINGSKYLTGFAWGSDVVGWVDMSSVYITNTSFSPPNFVSVNASASSGCAVQVSWVTNPDPVPAGTTFSVIDKNGVTLQGGINELIRSYIDTSTVAGGTYNYIVRASNTAGAYVDSVRTNDVTVAASCPSQTTPPTIGSFTASPSSVLAGQTCALTWTNIRNLDLTLPGNSCVITGPNTGGSTKFPYTLTSVSDGSTPSTPITSSSRYTLTCTNPRGSVQKTTTCNLKPKFNEF